MDWHKWWYRASQETLKLVLGQTIFQGVIRQFEIITQMSTIDVSGWGSQYRESIWPGDRSLTLKLEIELWPVGEVHNWDEPQAISPKKTQSIKPADKPLEIEKHRTIDLCSPEPLFLT